MWRSSLKGKKQTTAPERKLITLLHKVCIPDTKQADYKAEPIFLVKNQSRASEGKLMTLLSTTYYAFQTPIS